MKILLFALLIVAALWPEFSVAQINGVDLIGRWNLTSVTCFKDQKTYPAKGWLLTIDDAHFSSDISARCDLKYSLYYQLDVKQILLSPGNAYQNCSGTNTVIQVDFTKINYLRDRQKLFLELNNSYCHGLARYQFDKF